MAQKRGSQRGVIQLATSVMVVAFGALLGAAGCASAAEEDASIGSGGSERVGSVSQSLTCKNGDICNSDACATRTCGTVFPFGCVVKPERDGTACTSKLGGAGVCLEGICCNGCVQELKGGGFACRPGTEVQACGPVGEKCQNCDNGNTCETYSCSTKRTCNVDPVPDDAPCTDGSGGCYKGTCCAGCIDKNGECQAGNTTGQCGLSSTAGKLVQCQDCDDGVVCTNDPCTNGVCAAKTPKAGSCADANVCNGAETCSGTQCLPGTPLVCNDNNPCTVDSCDPAGGCKFTPKEVGTSCDDSTVCNGVAKCELVSGSIACKAGAAPDCNDGNICTTDSCDPVAGCKNVNNTVDCSDNNLCTLVDKCSGGTCVGTGAPNCDDNEPCTTDSCIAATGCKHAAKTENAACDDENGCTTGDKCNGGKCAGVGQSCEDTNPCTKTACTPGQGCSTPNEDNGTPCVFDKCHQNSTCQTGSCTAGEPIDCDDDNPCTTDSCDPLVGCKHVNANGGACSDGNLCTTGDKCQGGECFGTEVACKALDECHVAGSCDDKTGQCNDPRAEDDVECDDGKGTCQTGKCEPIPGAGGAGAGGETGTGTGGDGTAGTAVGQAGEPTTPAGGEGNEPGVGGAGNAPGTGANSSGGTDVQNNGGDGIDPDDIFVRDPGGCSCSVPSSNNSNALWLAGIALAAAAVRRRRSGSEKRS